MQAPEVEIRVGVAVVHHLHQPVIQPAGQFPPEGEKEQSELHNAQRDDCFKLPCREQQNYRYTNYQRHFEERLHHRQRLADVIKRRKQGVAGKPRADDPADAAEQLRLAEIIPRTPAKPVVHQPALRHLHVARAHQRAQHCFFILLFRLPQFLQPLPECRIDLLQ